MDARIKESHFDKLYRHSYCMVDTRELGEFMEELKDHKHYSQYQVTTEEEVVFTRVSLVGKKIYSY